MGRWDRVGGHEGGRPLLSSSLTRRTVLAGGATAVVLGGSQSADGWIMSRLRTVPLHTETAALKAPGVVVGVPRGRADSVLPGTRVLREAESRSRLRTDEARWLAGSSELLSRAGAWSGAVTDALLDLRILGLGRPATVAAWSSFWRYVWPRDLAHVSVALAAAGQTGEALAGLRFLQFVQGGNGGFEARYLPDGSGVPDGRHPQTDGTGWALWAAGQVLARLPAREAARAAAELRPLLERGTIAAMRAVGTPTGLPAASPDYWEVHEDALTLGTVAPLLAGLRAAPAALTLAGRSGLASRAGSAASALGERVHATFGPLDYPRSVRGGARDAAVTFLAPPYADVAGPGVVAAIDLARREMARPAGGFAPGGDWPDDGVSWTPETALLALADAGLGQRARASETLHWLADHRTDAGSYPEKVLVDGSPAEVAPLAWTAALVVLTVDALTRPA